MKTADAFFSFFFGNAYYKARKMLITIENGESSARYAREIHNTTWNEINKNIKLEVKHKYINKWKR